MSGYYTFYSTGFFGFGPPGTFKAYSLMHLMPILICVGLMVLVWFKRDRIREWKSEASLRLCISFLCFLMALPMPMLPSLPLWLRFCQLA